jgi:hypothetical protein
MTTPKQHLALTWLLVICLTACDARERASAPSPAADSQDPVYTVDPAATGPITLEELELDYDALSYPPSRAERDCIEARIDARLKEIGDLASFDPEDSGLFAARTSFESWKTFDARMKRILIAQAVVQRSLTDCQ